MSINNYKILLSRIFLFGFFLIILNGCSKSEKFEKGIVAYVGEHKITAQDFKLNYEFGFAHLKKKGNKKLSYLELMINEALLAQEGYRLGLDETDEVKRKEKKLLEELLVEEVFKKEVDDKIKISDEDVKNAINKSNVKWKLRYWVEPKLENALKVYKEIKKDGYENVVNKLLKKQEVKTNIKNYETDYLTWLDVPQEFLNEIKDLPVNQISKPIKLNNVYILVEITDIKSNVLADYDYKTEYEKYKQILFYREQKKQTPIFLKQFMEPKKIKTKREGLKYIFNAFLAWKKLKTDNDSFLNAIENADKTQPELLKLKEHYNDVLVTFKGGEWTIKNFLDHFDVSAVTAKVSEKGKIYNQINHEIAMSIRNKFFVEEALKNNFDKKEEVQKELKMWRDKWVYNEMRKNITQNVKTDEITALKYFNTHKNRYKTKENSQPKFEQVKAKVYRDIYFEKAFQLLDDKIAILKKEFPVRINKEVLDSIQVSDTEKSRWSTVFLFKGNTGRTAVPMVDPSWVIQK